MPINTTNDDKLDPVHPGEVLLHDFLEPFGLSQTKLAKEINVSPRRINEICLGKRSITADTALRLAKFFDVSPEIWMGLQAQFELDKTMENIGNALSQIHSFQTS